MSSPAHEASALCEQLHRFAGETTASQRRAPGGLRAGSPPSGRFGSGGLFAKYARLYGAINTWERGHLARTGPKARKVPAGATRPSRLLPRPRRPMPSRSALGALPRTGTGEARERGVARLAMWRACGPLAGGTPALPGCGPVSDVPGSAGLWPAPGRRPAKCRQERHARAGYSPARGAQCRRGRPWVHCRGRALEKPASVGVARLAMRRACGPLAGGTPALPGGGLGSDVPGSAGILPATGRRPAKRRQERDARGGHTPARGAQCRRGRPWVYCRGLALEKPESVGVARLPMRRACGPLAGGTPALPGGPASDVLGARASCPHRAEGPQSADRSEMPEGCCFPLYFVGSPRELLGLFRRRIAWDDGAIRDTWARGEVVELDWVDRWGRSSPVWGER